MRPKGFTLLESLVAAVVLAASILAVTMPMTVAVGNEQTEQRQTLANSLAQELLEEILSKPFRDPQGASQPGPEAGETSRGLFDNVDDYHGYQELPGGIIAANGQAVTGTFAAGLSRQVTAEYVYVAGQDTGGTPLFIRVAVTVREGNRTLVRLTRLVYAPP